jgi:hypothetical protein
MPSISPFDLPVDDPEFVNFMAGCPVRWPGDHGFIEWVHELYDKGAASVPKPPEAPTVSALTPNTIVSGDPDFTLTVDGANFVDSAVVSFDAADQETVFVSSTQLSATVLAASVAVAKTVGVNVRNPDGQRSADISFVIT